MRTVTFGVANSLDNYIARRDDSVDWLLWSDDMKSLMTDFWKNIDTVLMGRKTYEASLKHGRGSGGTPGMKTYVFSRTIKESDDKDVEIISEDVANFLKKLKNQAGKDICVMGGGELAKPLFEANLIDKVGLNIHPILLGSGIPLFLEMKHQVDLELIECKSFKNGCVYVSYRVTK